MYLAVRIQPCPMKRILVPVDFSENARDALLYALSLSKNYGFEVEVLNVTKIATKSHFISTKQIESLEETSKGEGMTKLKSFLAETPGAEKATPIIRIGFAIEEIISLCERSNYDMIVMGTKGVTNLRDRLFGTNTANVIESVRIPVLSVPAGTKFKPLERLTYVCNLESVNLPALGRLMGFGRITGARLTFLHYNSLADLGSEKNRGFAMQHVREVMPDPGISLDVLHEENLAMGVTSYTKDHPTDLLAVSLTEHGTLNRLFGTSIDRELREQLVQPIFTMHA